MKKFKEIRKNLDEAHSNWHVHFKSKHSSQMVKARNTAEAIKKAEKKAKDAEEHHGEPIYKGVKKVSK